MIDFNINKNIKKYIVLFFLILAMSVVCFIIIKYQVEGEKNIPFSITKLMVISSAKTDTLEFNDNLYQANIIQNNDIYIAIEKNENYSKEDSIKKIIFNNFNILEEGKAGNFKIYRTTVAKEVAYEYLNEYEIKDNMEFIGDLNTNLKMDKMTIANQGGLLQFSIILNDLGKITYEENENIISDGTLLKKLNLKTEDIRLTISFDMIMELSSGNIFKTTILLELPEGDIVNEGVCTKEDIDLNKLVFKRI